jgi:protein-tyrosine phosphatase
VAKIKMLFFKKKETTTDLSFLGTDMHSHLVPGIDDGVPDMEASLAMIRGFAELGYRKLITTPHVLGEVYPNTRSSILTGMEQVKEALTREKIDVEFHAAAEYFIDERFMELLEKKEPLLTVSGNMVLVEISMMTAPLNLQDSIFEIQMQGYQPIIAHPERYIYLARNKQFFETLRDAGCMFQLNLLSLSGGYGKTVTELAEYLLKNEFYDFAGSDLHGQKHLDGLKALGGSSLYKKLVAYSRFKNQSL